MYCPHCIAPVREGEEICPSCGKELHISNRIFQLPVGTVLGGRYWIGRSIGQGGFGITYVGCDLKLNMKIAVKEYYPQGIVTRVTTSGTAVMVTMEEREETYRAQRERFDREARILAKFAGSPAVVKVSDILSENNTSYIIMEFVPGINLETYVSERGRLPLGEVLSLLYPIMDVLGEIHGADLIHRDISPENIMLDEKHRTVKLLDFGAARAYDQEGQSLSVVLKPGYAPPEQYDSRGRQGPWTDVYALCATIYRLITGSMPDFSINRFGMDTLLYPAEAGAEGITPEQEAVLMCGLAVWEEKRFQSMPELKAAFEEAAEGEVPERALPFYRGKKKEEVPAPPAEDPEKKKKEEKKEEKRGQKGLIAAAALLAAAVLAALLFLWLPGPGEEPAVSEETAAEIPAEASVLAAYREAAPENPGAALLLGRAYEQGYGVPESTEEAVRYYRLAAEMGSAEAQEALERLAPEGGEEE